MKFGALAPDYDGTIAVKDVLDGEVRDAIGAVRRQGVAVLLVTGRRLADLRRVAGDLACFDAIVAENGAVLHFPVSGRHTVVGVTKDFNYGSLHDAVYPVVLAISSGVPGWARNSPRYVAARIEPESYSC